MILLFFKEEEKRDKKLGKTAKMLSGCGFQVSFIKKDEVKKLKKGILITKTKKRRNNNEENHRRRFISTKEGDLCLIQYVEGAEIDSLWWRDLCFRISQVILKENLFQETSSLEKLKNKTLLP